MTKAILIAAAVLLCASLARAQAGPGEGSHELEVWTGGGHGLNGSTSDTGVWNVGGRYGWILTGPVGPGFLRGRFEYAVDVVPIFCVFQRNGATYGGGVNPFALDWIFVPRHNVAPYVDLGGGTLFTTEKVPPEISHINFTTSGALGLHFIRQKYTWSVDVRYMHISNAGLTVHNPGINTLQVRLGFGMFRQPH
jgi:hypothetical protein